MKKSNRFSVRVSALVLALVMVFTFSVPAFAAGDGFVTTDYYTISYDSTTTPPQIIVTVDAAKLGEFASDPTFSKAELTKFLPEILANAIENRTIPSIEELIDFLPDDMLTYEGITKIIPEGIFTSLLTADKLNELLSQEAMNELLTKDVMNSLLTKDVLNQLLTDEVKEELLTAEVINSLLTKEVKEELLTTEVINSLLTKDVKNTLFTECATEIKALVTNDVIETLIGTAEEAKSFVDKGIIDISAVQNLLESSELLEASGSADPEATALQLAINNHSAELAGLLSAKLDDVIDVVGFDKIISAVTLDKIIETVTLDKIIEVVTLDKIIETVTLDKIIEKVTLDKIIEVVTLEKIIEKVTLDKIIEVVTLDKIIETVTLDKIIEVVTLEKIISTVGVDNIVTAVGLDNIIKAVDKSKLTTFIKNSVSNIILNQVDAITLYTESNGANVTETVFAPNSNDSGFNLNLAGFANVVAKSLPTVDTLSNMADGDILYHIGFAMDFASGSEAGIEIAVKVEGNTSTIKQYANKVFSVFNYQVLDDVHVDVNIDDTAHPLFAKALEKALTTDKLTDAQKAELFTLFTKKGEDLIDALEALDISILTDRVSELEEARDKIVSALKTAMEKLPEKYQDITLASLYEGNGSFAFDESASISTSKLIDKLAAMMGISANEFDSWFTYDETIDGAFCLNVQMADVYRVTYYNENNEPVYTTFLPAGASLEVINANTAAIKDLASDGWMDADGNVVTEMPAYDIDLFEEVDTQRQMRYAIFVARGETVAKIPFYEGATKLSYVPEVPARKGYSGKWEDYTLGNSDITINAIYTNITHYATFMADGKVVDIVKFYEGDEVLSIVPKVPVKDYCDGKWEYYTLGKQDIVIKAIYTNRVHYATFMADGVVVDVVEFNEGTFMIQNPPAVPAKENYRGEWELYQLGATDVTINAVYTRLPYTIVFDANGGTGTMLNQVIDYDVQVALNANTFTREGYKFTGWNTKADGTGITYKDGMSVKNLAVSGEVTLYAQWEVIVPDTYTVTFMADGVVVDTVTFEKGAANLSRVPAVPAKAGYTGVWEVYVLGEADITVNAIYTANTYKIVFNANGGTGAMANMTVTYDETVQLTANAFTQEGYTFKCWNTKVDGTGTVYTDGVSVKNLAEDGEVTLYAQWEVIEKNWTPLIITAAVIGGLVAVGAVVFFVVKKKK